MTANLRLLNPIHQIVSQKIQTIGLETSETSYDEFDLVIFEDQRYVINTTLDISFNSDFNGKEVKKIKAHVWDVYDNNEGEDLMLSDKDQIQLEKYLSNNLLIELQ